MLFAGAEGYAQGGKVRFTPGGGFWAGPQEPKIQYRGPGVIHYTTDGSTPTAASARYPAEPIYVDRPTVVRAAAFDPASGRALTPVAGASYLIGERAGKLLTLSVGIDPWRLYDRTHGWLRPGPGADPDDWRQAGANFWTHREHPAHLSLLETDGREVFAATVGYRLFGGMSRLEPQKSFSLSVRKRYGAPKIDYPVFGPGGKDDFRFLVARNGGSDWGRSYLRDALLTGLLQDPSWDLERQAARPVRVFLNGRYHGVYHLREKINVRYLQDRHPGVHRDSIDLLEHQHTVKHGSLGAYRELLRVLGSRDPARPEDFAAIERRMDTDNFMRLQIAQTFFDNRDAGGNIRYWRPQRPGGRFRWILYDVDQGFGLHQDGQYRNNTLDFYTDPAGPSWPNPPWSTFVHRRLLRNADYRRQFVNRSLDYLHTDFAAPTVLAALDRRVAELEPEMPRHLERWGRSAAHWRAHLRRLREFATHRPAHLREHLRAFAGGGADVDVHLSAGPGGSILLNENLAIRGEFHGSYFAGLPVSVRPVADPGHRFAGWADEDQRHARFEPVRHELADRVIINEVCPRGGGGGDWLELHNRGEEVADLSGWQLHDGSGRPPFRFPNGQLLEAGDYLVVCRKPDKFRRHHPRAHHVIGGLPFGLNRRADRLGLYSRGGAYVNTVAWDLPPQDSAFVLALLLPGLDNTVAGNWRAEPGRGTPAAANPRHLVSAVISRQGYWLRIGVGVSVLLLLALLRVRKDNS